MMPNSQQHYINDSYIILQSFCMFQAPPANGTNGNGAGRASHRGGARGEPRPGAPVNAPETQFAAMSLGTGDAPTARQGRERRPMSYQEPHTRPQDCADKRGAFCYQPSFCL